MPWCARTPAAGIGGDVWDQPGEAEDASLLGDRPAITFRGDAGWQIQRPSTPDHPTEAYTDAPSYLPGQTLRLAVSTDAPAYTVAFYRLGAAVQPMGDSTVQPGVRQGGPTIDPVTKMARAGWRYTYSQPLPRAVLFSGHGEYWGASLRDWLDQHVLRQGDLGLGLFAADTGYWQVSLSGPASTAPRTIGLYKDARFDPAVAARCPGGFTRHANAFRSLPCGVGHRAGNRPEQALFGVQYGDVVPGYYPYRLTAGAPAGLLAGTGLAPGDSLGQIAGGEVDRVFPGIASLPGDHLFASTMTVTRAGATVAAQAVVRALPSGGRVFASGTFWWGWGLEPGFARAHGVPAGFGQLTVNLLNWLAGG